MTFDHHSGMQDPFSRIDVQRLDFSGLMGLALVVNETIMDLTGERMVFSSDEFFLYRGGRTAPHMISKGEVYRTICDYAVPGEETELMLAVEEQYPTREYGERAPRAEVFEYLFNERLRDHHR